MPNSDKSKSSQSATPNAAYTPESARAAKKGAAVRRTTFKVRDLVLTVAAGGSGGGTALPADDGPVPTPVTPFTPVIQVATHLRVLDALAANVKEAIVKKDVVGIRAVVDSRTISMVAEQVGRAAVAGAFQSGAAGGAGYPNPDCGGSSLETIPTPITPIVLTANVGLRAEHLPALKQRLRATLDAIEAAERTLEVHGAEETKFVTQELEGALAELRGR